MGNERSELVLVVAPIGRDAELMVAQLAAAGLQAAPCKDIRDVCGRLVGGAGVLVLTEEALPPAALAELTKVLRDQPPWSEIPVVILTGAPSLDVKQRTFEDLRRRTNVTLVDRPVRITTLISSVQSALRARQRQYEVRDLMRQLEDRIQERDRFLAVLGHELRNPLAAILLASQMTDADGKLDGEHAHLIERQSQHLSRLVNDLLDLSRVAAGKIVLKREIIDLREIVAQSVRVVKPGADKHGLDIRVSQPEDPVTVDADPIRIDQIVTNLLTNAIKYTPEGGHVSLTLGRDGGDAYLNVSDDGVGIAPERIGGIFELFAQAENAIGRAQGGMGIGLALVRNLVHLHDGKVEARSAGLGKGSSFEVRFPLAGAVTSQGASESHAAHAPRGGPRRIVIVEDNKDIRDLLGLKLRRLGHIVEAASDGEEGLRLLLSAQPDLALVDLGLPGIDGYEVAKETREKLGDGIVLVAVSGFGQPEDKRRAIESGFDEHITKPADVREIENILHRFPPRNTSSPEVV
ncbi:MAG TPA: hybrid sensor histidine kinase/response regulator [Thermoanaerobaculia bacterium]|nr:hybrid sensor histidine kinase/response regulator [Thermoanaerobaculia bacterium]